MISAILQRISRWMAVWASVSRDNSNRTRYGYIECILSIINPLADNTLHLSPTYYWIAICDSEIFSILASKHIQLKLSQLPLRQLVGRKWEQPERWWKNAVHSGLNAFLCTCSIALMTFFLFLCRVIKRVAEKSDQSHNGTICVNLLFTSSWIWVMFATNSSKLKTRNVIRWHCFRWQSMKANCDAGEQSKEWVSIAIRVIVGCAETKTGANKSDFLNDCLICIARRSRSKMSKVKAAI